MQYTGSWYPRPRGLVRNPGVPDKPPEALGNMSRYSAQVLICFIAYIFQFVQFLCGLGWEPCISGLPRRPLPQSSVFRMRLFTRQSRPQACLAWAFKMQQDETLSGIYASDLVKLTDNMDAIDINETFFSRGTKLTETFTYLYVKLISGVLNWSSQVVLKIN